MRRQVGYDGELSRVGRPFQPGVGLTELALWFRSLWVLFGAGVPIHRALEVVAQGTASPRLQELTERVLALMHAGHRLSTALQRTGFPLRAHGLALVKIGEETGRFHEVLGLLADLLEKEDAARRRLRASLTYPAILASAAMLLGAALIFFIVPMFVNLLEGMSAQLSPLARLMFAVARWLADPWLWLLVSQAGLLLGAELVFWRRSLAGRLACDRLLLRLPVIGRMVRANCMARITHVFGLMVQCGCPQDRILKSLAGVVDNQVVRADLARAQQRVIEDGASLHEALESAVGFDPLFVCFVATGEESGRLHQMLLRAHALYEEECERCSRTVSALVEPLVLGVMGVLSGGVLIMLFLPISELNRAL